MAEVCPLCGQGLAGTEVVLTDDGWTHIGCLDEEEFEELLGDVAPQNG